MTVATRRSTCRLCNGGELTLVLPMQPSPIGDAFVPAEAKHVAQPLIPLDLYLCASCGHVQNLDIVDPSLLFRDYLFTTGSSAGLVEHFRRYAAEVMQRFDVPAGSLVVEIGSNDGTLLRFFASAGLRVLGVDPARDIANQATDSGIPTISDFFTSSLASDIVAQHGAANLVLANNVFAHTDALADVADGIRILLDGGGVFVFEGSYLLDIVDRFLFDTVYHEHLSYHSVRPLARFFERHDLHLFDVERIASKGGSIRGFVQKAGGPHEERASVHEMIAEEDRRGLHDPQIFHDLARRITARKQDLLEHVDRARRAGKSVAGYGASPTTTTLTYQFELEDRLDSIVDDNPRKHGLYSPGRHLEVRPSTTLYEQGPDVVVILAWQYADAIIAKHEGYLENGGEFLIPLPKVRSVRRTPDA